MSGRGAPALHDALAAYLNRVRGTSARPEPDRDLQRLRPGNRRSSSSARDVRREAAGARGPVRRRRRRCRSRARPAWRSSAVPVDADGIRVDALDRTDADALVLTPSHQWPTGAVLSADRRAAVLRWARERRALVVEDDYDAEYRYDRAPIGAMQGLAPDLVVYAGTASKTLAPGLRLGWLVVAARPRRRRRRGQAARRPRLARPRSARVRRLRGPGRVRSSPAPDAAPLPSPPRRAARGPRRASCPTSSRPGSPPGSTSSPTCPRASTRRRSSRPRPGAASRSTAWRPIASPARAARASSSATRRSASARSPRGPRSSPRRSPTCARVSRPPVG